MDVFAIFLSIQKGHQNFINLYGIKFNLTKNSAAKFTFIFNIYFCISSTINSDD